VVERGCAVADEKEGAKKRGAKGGVKHTPGCGHTRNSGPEKKKRFQRKAARKRRAKHNDLQKQWQEWDALPAEVQKLRPEKKPKQPRPTDER
jgi:hypothetical protein